MLLMRLKQRCCLNYNRQNNRDNERLVRSKCNDATKDVQYSSPPSVIGDYEYLYGNGYSWGAPCVNER